MLIFNSNFKSKNYKKQKNHRKWLEEEDKEVKDTEAAKDQHLTGSQMDLFADLRDGEV